MYGTAPFTVAVVHGGPGAPGHIALDIKQDIIEWLLQGDPSIRWQTLRDLTDANEEAVQTERQKIATEGWGARLLALQEDSGMWGGGVYTPKWKSTTYTMLLLRRLGLDPKNAQTQKGCQLLLEKGFYRDGGINYFRSLKHSETCVTGMILSILAYFGYQDERVDILVEHLLAQQMPDGGWNCQSYKGATHSSFHTTIIVLEGLWEFEKRTDFKLKELTQSQRRGCEFLLAHRLYRSHQTGEIVDPRMTRFSFPPRWRYDILRALDYFQAIKLPYNDRMSDALEIVRKKQQQDGTWVLQNRHSGKTFFEMERVGKPSRWNTLRALRVLCWFERCIMRD